MSIDSNYPVDTENSVNLNIFNSASVQARNKASILLMVKLSVLSSAGIGISTRCLFDTGSQETCISHQLVNKLCIAVSAHKRLSLEGINSRIESKLYDMVNLFIRTDSVKISMEAIVVEKLPDKISMPGRDEAIKTLTIRGVQLADDGRGDSGTDLEILVGIDNYFKFVNAQLVTDDLFLIPSRVGNNLSGSVACENREQVALSTILRVGSCETADSWR